MQVALGPTGSVIKKKSTGKVLATASGNFWRWTAGTGKWVLIMDKNVDIVFMVGLMMCRAEILKCRAAQPGGGGGALLLITGGSAGD